MSTSVSGPWSRKRQEKVNGKRLINIPAAAALLDPPMKPDTFYRWQRRGWPQLGYEPLLADLLPLAGSPFNVDPDDHKGKEEMFDRDDVLRLARLRRQEDRTGHRHTERGLRYNRKAVLRELDIGATRLLELVDAGHLTEEPGKSTLTGKAEVHYLPAEVENVKPLLAVTRGQELERDGKKYLRGKYVLRLLKITQQTLGAWGGCGKPGDPDYREGRCPHLKGGAPLPRIEEYGPSRQAEQWYGKDEVFLIQKSLGRQKAGPKGPVSKKRQKVRQRLEADSGKYEVNAQTHPSLPAERHGIYLSLTAVEREFNIHLRELEKLVSRGLVAIVKVPNTVGRGREKTIYRKDDLTAYREAMEEEFDGCYPDELTHQGPAYNLSRIEKELGCSRLFITSQFERSDFHPAGKLPHTERDRPVSKGRRSGRDEETVTVKDLVLLAEGMIEALEGGRLDHRSRTTAKALGHWLNERKNPEEATTSNGHHPVDDAASSNGESGAAGKNGAGTTADPRPAVVLGRPGGPVMVRGRPKPPLTPPKYRVIKALLDAFPDGLVKNKLATNADYTDPHKLLAELCEDHDWDAAVYRPGKGFRGGYRIVGM